MTYVFYLDRYHLGDPLFLSGFARDVLGLDAPCLIVHGAGEAAERALEARGQVARWEEGVLVAETGEERALVARAARDLNRRIAHALNDAGVASVPLEAGGRGLVAATETGLEVAKAGWLHDLVARRAVPVVAALVAAGARGVREVNGGAVAGALARAWGEGERRAIVMFLGRKRVLTEDDRDSGTGWISLGDVPGDALPEPDAVRAALGAGAEVRLIGRSGLRGKPMGGTRIGDGSSEESA